MKIKNDQWLGLGLDIVVGCIFALTGAAALLFVLFVPFWSGLLITSVLYIFLRTLSWMGSRADLDI